ncbi:hypothetical protein ACFXTI_046785 [Malus domestica]
MTRSSQPVREHIFDFDGDFERMLRRKKKLHKSNPPSPEPELEEQEVEVEEEATTRVEEEVPTMAVDNRTIKELSALGLANAAPICIQYPRAAPEKTDEFELKSSLLHHIPKFHGLSMEDPNKHLKEFEVVCSSMTPVNVFFTKFPSPISPNVFIPCRIMQSKEKEGEKGIFETFPKTQEQEVGGECLEFIKEDTLETKIPKEVGFYDTGQVLTLKTPNLAKSHIPATFKDVVFVIKFVLEQASKPFSPTLILLYTNLLILMILAPTLEFKPLLDHVKYHRPFKDQFHDTDPIQV